MANKDFFYKKEADAFFKRQQKNLNDNKFLLTRIENNSITDRQAKIRRKEIDELQHFEKTLTITNDIEYIDEWTPIPKLAMPMWKNKITKDQKTIYDLFAVPSYISVL